MSFDIRNVAHIRFRFANRNILNAVSTRKRHEIKLIEIRKICHLFIERPLIIEFERTITKTYNTSRVGTQNSQIIVTIQTPNEDTLKKKPKVKNKEKICERKTFAYNRRS